MNSDNSMALDPSSMKFSLLRRKDCTKNIFMATIAIIGSIAVMVPIAWALSNILSWLYAHAIAPGADMLDVASLAVAGAAIGGVFLWPIICLAAVAITGLVVLLIILKALVKGEFVTEDLLSGEKKGELVEGVSVGLLTDAQTIPPEVYFIDSKKINTYGAEWYKVRTLNGTYAVLSVDIKRQMPSTVINSHIEKYETLQSKYENGVSVSINKEVEKYFTIFTVPGAERAVFDMLPPNALWDMQVSLDSCDIELRDTKILFVWSENIMTSVVMSGREKKVTGFIRSIANAHAIEKYPDAYLHVENARQKSSSLKSIFVQSIVIAIALSIGSGIWAGIGSKGDLVSIIVASMTMLIVGALIGMCFALILALFKVAIKMVIYAFHLASDVSRIRNYLFYYQGRN